MRALERNNFGAQNRNIRKQSASAKLPLDSSSAIITKYSSRAMLHATERALSHYVNYDSHICTASSLFPRSYVARIELESIDAHCRTNCNYFFFTYFIATFYFFQLNFCFSRYSIFTYFSNEFFSASNCQEL